jgi:hypothetical protein
MAGNGLSTLKQNMSEKQPIAAQPSNPIKMILLSEASVVWRRCWPNQALVGMIQQSQHQATISIVTMCFAGMRLAVAGCLGERQKGHLPRGISWGHTCFRLEFISASMLLHSIVFADQK